MNEKLEAFRALFEADKKEYYKGLECHAHSWPCSIKIGRKYANIDVGTVNRSGAYMVDLATGEIFGIKGYGVIHRGHKYGTLDTINDWHWGEYRAVRKQKVSP